MTPSLHWYAHDIEAYDKKTVHLSLAQDGAYRRLLSHYYRTGSPLPPSEDAVLRICRAMTRDERDAVLFVLRQFFVLADDGFHNLRADEEIVKAANLAAAKARAGALGGESARGRSGRRKNSSAIPVLPAEGTAEECQENTQLQLHKHSSASAELARAREEDTTDLQRLSRLLGFDEGNFHQYAKNIEILVKLRDEGCDFERHIWPAAQAAVRAKPKSLAYIRPKAIELRDAEKTVRALPAPFDDTDLQGWRDRSRVFREKGMWSDRWGPKPDEPGCRIPPQTFEPRRHAGANPATAPDVSHETIGPQGTHT